MQRSLSANCFHFTAIISFLNVPSLDSVELNTETPCIFWRVQDLREPSSIWGPQMKIEITELRWREQKIIIVNQNKKKIRPWHTVAFWWKFFSFLHNITYVLLNLTGKKTAVDVTTYHCAKYAFKTLFLLTHQNGHENSKIRHTKTDVSAIKRS